MDSPKPAVDLEGELTCSICTEILYQPLTLLDCLHTFCGACLKDWFSWQATAAENSPNPPPSGANFATCPSCRATVRDTRHNATVATLLDMFLSANPEKARSEEDKQEMHEKYKPGDNVLPRIHIPEKSPEERRLEQLERHMLEQAREMSLRDAGVEDSSNRPRSSRREQRARHREQLSDRSDRESSRDSRHRETHDRARRTTREEGRRHRTDSNSTLQPQERTRQRSSGSRQSTRDRSDTDRRPIEHQASIRSLISSSSVDSLDMEREIEEFARQIQEEGLLDGLDLDDIDLTRNDELSRRITEAYRRRQTHRSRPETTRRAASSRHSPHPETVSSSPRPPTANRSRDTSRQRASSETTRPSSSALQTEDRSRPPVTSTHLEVRGPSERRRRRTSSSGRSATDPIRPRTTETRPAARSQTDLTLRNRTSDTEIRRPSFGESRSSSMPTSNVGNQAAVGLGLSFGERASSVVQNPITAPTQPATPPAADTPAAIPDEGHPKQKQRPSSLVVYPHSPLPSLGVPMSPGAHKRIRSQYYQEPSITCKRCSKPHIEYELHYNCAKCDRGEWNLCLDCYRRGKGCLHWFGFGYSAYNKWEKARAQGNQNLESPHMLTSNRYIPPKSMPGGADGRRTMTTVDPLRRLQTGMFCARCFTWANGCYWRCELCNEGEWGFCNDCVNQGRSCTHPLLPLSYVSPSSASSPPASPRIPHPPASARVYSESNALALGNYHPLTFTTSCSVCRSAIPPSQERYHCYSCTSTIVAASTVVADMQPGDYEVCMACYTRLEAEHRISSENGRTGWRRCLKGHRMVVLGFQFSNGGERRVIVQDLVGGADLRMETYEPAPGEDAIPGLQKWWWNGPNRSKVERLVTSDVAASPPSTWATRFPPDGGVGMRATAQWSWYPQPDADDELLFPKGAEIKEIEDVNEEWFFGCYMGSKGLFPAPFVKLD